VRIAAALLTVIGSRLEIAFGGHMHRREELRLITPAGALRFNQTAAIVGPASDDPPLGAVSGITLYRVDGGRVDGGTFIPLDPIGPER
jgi:hypothetical protein